MPLDDAPRRLSLLKLATGIEPVTSSLPRTRSTDWATRARAGDGARTRDPQLGRLMLYQLSYARAPSGGGRIRTFVGCRRQIYSLLPLATRAPHRALLGPSDDAPRVREARGVCIPP